MHLINKYFYKRKTNIACSLWRVEGLWRYGREKNALFEERRWARRRRQQGWWREWRKETRIKCVGEIHNETYYFVYKLLKLKEKNERRPCWPHRQLQCVPPGAQRVTESTTQPSAWVAAESCCLRGMRRVEAEPGLLLRLYKAWSLRVEFRACWADNSRDVSFVSPHPRWVGLFSVTAAFGSPQLLLCNPSPIVP